MAFCEYLGAIYVRKYYLNIMKRIDFVTTRYIDGEKKMIMYLDKVFAPIVINKTNMHALIEAYGDDTDVWVGKLVRLDVVKVPFNGKNVSSIRIIPARKTTIHGEVFDE